MGKATGFLDYKREGMKWKLPKERIGNWEEFFIKMETEQRKEQAGRCMECGVPFCHSGIVLGGMTSGCPINNLIPEWNDLIFREKWYEAYKRLEKTNKFPEFTGRVCPAPCEGACTVGCNGEAVTIKNNELEIIEKAFKNGWVNEWIPVKKSGKSVAVIGSGPAGLTCADDLNRLGHDVTVFEREDRAGGLLMYGIPNMKLDKKLIRRRIELLEERGINFVYNTEIGRNYAVDELKRQFDAIILCCGTGKARDLNVKGRNLEGVHLALDYLRNNTKRLLGDKQADLVIDAKDKNVVVIGGGDTGTDCVATAIRQGCKSIVQFEIMPELVEYRGDDNPWPEWPKVKKVDYGHEEAVYKFGRDPRRYEVMTKGFLGENNKVKHVETVKIRWNKNLEGGFDLEEIPESDSKWDSDLVLLALGFEGAEDELMDKFDLCENRKQDLEMYTTNLEGVFIAGDMRRGQSLVVWAIKEGKEVAKVCHCFLNR